MCIYQAKCDELGFSATLWHNQNRATDQKVAGSNPAERAKEMQFRGPNGVGSTASCVQLSTLCKRRPPLNLR